MKVGMNNIGNYTPHSRIQKGYNNQPKVEQKQEVKAKEVPAEDKNITQDEKTFFMGLYPENKNEIVDYHFYQKSGKMSGVQLGSLFDKKG